MATFLPSRARYRDYREHVRQRRRDPDRRAGARGEDDAGLPMHEGFRKARSTARGRGFGELLAAFWGFLGADRRTLRVTLGLVTFAGLLALVPLYAPKLVVDHVLGDVPRPAWLDAVTPAGTSPMGLLGGIFVVTIALVAIATAIRLLARWQGTKLSKRLQVSVRKRVFDHASMLPLHRVYELKSGGVSSMLRDDAGAVGGLVFAMVYNPWQAIVQLVGSLAVLIWVDWRLLVIALAILPVVWFTHRTWISNIRPMWRDVRHTRKGVDAHASEAFGGIRVVRAFGKRRAEAANFVRGNDMMIRQELFTWWWSRAVDTAWAILIPLATATLLLVGGWRVLADRDAVAAGTMAAHDALTVGGLVAFLSYLAALLGPIATLAATATQLQDSLAGLDRVLDLLQEEPEMQPQPGDLRVNRADVAGRVTLDGLGFRYPKAERWALRGVDLDVPPGSVVAFVGASGAGKTTLCNLIARLYDPTEGAVLLDGVDLRAIDVNTYRRLLGIVEQDVFLFDGTVGQNIAYARRDADPREIEQAAERAHAHGFIADMPHGYDTLVGERGVKLSGGQRQRLAIARALLADPKVLILDEATSALDTHTERLIQSALEGLMRDRTSFVIAHRLSTITHADTIVVLDEGRVVETGTHDRLMADSTRYRGMIHAQLTPEPLVAAEG